MNSLSKFIGYVPKTPAENLQWRLSIRSIAMESVDAQQTFKQAAFEDPLFFFQAFAFLYEPRALIKVIPYCLWPHQAPAIVTIDQCISRTEIEQIPIDVVVDKARAQGATWIACYIILRRWLRDPFFSAGIVTRNMEAGDSNVDPDAIMWKLHWALMQLPYWMKPGGQEYPSSAAGSAWDRSLTYHSLINNTINSTATIYPATGDVTSGGRKTVFFFDEVAKFKPTQAVDAANSTQHVTHCRLFVSTHKSDSGLYFDMVNDENSNAVKVVLDWMDNPSQNKNAYIIRKGIIAAIKPEEQEAVNKYYRENSETFLRLKRRGYQIEGKVRSPWYDAQCLRPGATPRGIAQELDRNPRGTVGKVFDIETMDRMKSEHCRPPDWEGDLILDPDTYELKILKQQIGGPLKLWFAPSVDDRKAPAGLFAIGADISAGGQSERASNSSAAVVNRQTGEQVAEYTVFGKMATIFARYVVALAKWFNFAYLGWEATGPTGSQFKNVVMDDLHYTNVYTRDSGEPGWWNKNDSDKIELFESLCIAFMEGEFIPRSVELLRECNEWEIGDDGKIVHQPSRMDGLSEKAHGDRCVGAGVALLCCKDRPIGKFAIDKNYEVVQNAPYGTWQWRQEQAKKQDWARRDEEGFIGGGDDFSIYDLLGPASPTGFFGSLR